ARRGRALRERADRGTAGALSLRVHGRGDANGRVGGAADDARRAWRPRDRRHRPRPRADRDDGADRMMTRARVGALAPYAGLAALLALSAPAWPDDWDGLGFVAAVKRFDMDRFAPHAPGYPVYVAMLKVAAIVVRDPVRAAVAVAVLCGAGAAAFAYGAAARAFGRGRGAAVAFAVVATPLAWRATSGVGTECAALLFATACAFGLAHARGWTLGLAAGLGMGVRLSWAPLYLALLALAPRGTRVRAAAGASFGVLAWLVPLVAVVGPRHLESLYATHLAGHALRWGGTAIAHPVAPRLA